MHENPTNNGEIDAAQALEAAFDWWREAGVDHDYAADPHSWLASPEAEEAVAAPKPVARVEEPKPTPLQRAFQQAPETGRIGGDAADWPDDLGKFREWWMSEASLSLAGTEARLPPRGVAGTKLMVLVAEPYADDGDALLSGGAGRFAAAILKAMGVEPHEAYLASALPAPAALADWEELAANGLSAVTAHHIALAAPERVLVFGRGLAPLFGIAPAAAREPAMITAGERQVPLLLAPDLAELSRTPERRMNFWNRWLEWTA